MNTVQHETVAMTFVRLIHLEVYRVVRPLLRFLCKSPCSFEVGESDALPGAVDAPPSFSQPEICALVVFACSFTV